MREGAPEGPNDAVMYRGFAHLPDEDVPLAIRVALPSGATTAELPDRGGEGSPSADDRDRDLAKAAAALIRSATKSAVSAGGPLPRKIVRWR